MWFGTPLLFYMYVAPPMSHACSAFAVAAFLVDVAARARALDVGGGAALGALAALMAMVREQDLLIVVVGPALDWALAWWRAPEDSAGPAATAGSPAHALAGAVAFAIGYAPQLLAYTALNGYPGPSRLVARKMNWLAPHAARRAARRPSTGCCSGRRWRCSRSSGSLPAGRLVRLDGATDADAAAATSARRRGSRCACCSSSRSQVYVAGSVESWTVAGAFGQRRFVGLTAVFLVGLAALWPIADRRGGRRRGARPGGRGRAVRRRSGGTSA